MEDKLTREEMEFLQKNNEVILGEISKAIVGYQDIVEDFLIGLLCGGHILMEGVPGIAKTTLAKGFAQITGLKYSRIQFTQDLLPADIMGHYYYDQKESQFLVRKGPIFSEIVLADEINRAPPKTQSALLEAMEETQVTIEGNTFPLPENFMVIATINPIEAEGVYPLPEAQLDRFMFKSKMDYLKPRDEYTMLKKKSAGELGLSNLKEVDPIFITRLKGAFSKVYISDHLVSYIRDIVQGTRDQKNLVLGASPRAGEQMIYAAKGLALLEGRDHVLPDDIKHVAGKILIHRLILSVDAEIEGLGVEAIIDDIIKSVRVPKGEEKKKG
jgi:MoxR-like ATPase